jgi:hypothetical protein
MQQKEELTQRHTQILDIVYKIDNGLIYDEPYEMIRTFGNFIEFKGLENIHNHDYWIGHLNKIIQNPNPFFSTPLDEDALSSLNDLLEKVYVSKIYSVIKEHANNPSQIIQKIEGAISPKERKDHPNLYVLFDNLYFVVGYELLIKYHQEKTSKLESKSEIESKAKSALPKTSDNFNLAIETWKKIGNLAHLPKQEGELVSNVLEEIDSNIKSSVKKEKSKVTFSTFATWNLRAIFSEAFRPAVPALATSAASLTSSSSSSVSSSMASDSSMEAVDYADSSFIIQLVIKKSYERNAAIEAQVSSSIFSSNKTVSSTGTVLSILPKSVSLSRESSYDNLKDILEAPVEEDTSLVKDDDPIFQAKLLKMFKKDASGTEGYELADRSPSESYTSESESELVSTLPMLPVSEQAAPNIAPKRQGM